jgi:hypothetical protein
MKLLEAIFWFLLASMTALWITNPAWGQDQPQCDPPESTESTYVYPDMTGGCDHSFVSLGPPKVKNAVATVTYYNTATHGPQHNDEYTLTYEGLTVTILYVWSSGDDTVEVVPPEGYIASPQRVDVSEGATQEYHIYQYLGG